MEIAEVQTQETPPRIRWSLSVRAFPSSNAKMQRCKAWHSLKEAWWHAYNHNSTECCKYEKGGVLIKKFTGRSAQYSQGGRDTNHGHSAPTCSCTPKSSSLRNQIRNSNTLTRRASMIMRVIAMTPPHLEKMVMIVLGNPCTVVRTYMY